jgi:hypothetical protein
VLPSEGRGALGRLDALLERLAEGGAARQPALQVQDGRGDAAQVVVALLALEVVGKQR